jgi:hypothetical protein
MDHDEWCDAVNDFTEWDWAPYDEPDIYADTLSADGTRL